jgi:hypothetical protein
LEGGEDCAALPPLYHVSLRFPRRLHGTFERLLDDAAAKKKAEAAAYREERAARYERALRVARARSGDRSRSPRDPSSAVADPADSEADSTADSTADSEADSSCQHAVTAIATQEMRREVHRLLAVGGGAGGDHEQVQVESPSGVIEVDVGMVEVLQAIWALGVRTAMSCQDNQGCVWVCFDLVEYLRFLDLAKRAPPLHRFLCLSHTYLHSAYQVLDLRFPTAHKQEFLDLLRVARA